MTRLDRPTMTDVAAAARVGVATVDRVLNRRAPVREETARRVLEAARALGFRATGLVQKRIDERLSAHTLGFLLQRGGESFYRLLGQALAEETRRCQSLIGRPLVHYLDDLRPTVVAAALLRLAGRADALAFVAADHPAVRKVVDDIRARGQPVFALLSDVTSTSRSGFLGIDHRKAGRTAAWAMCRLSKRTGPLGVMVGTHRYIGHELCEMSFRAALREHAPALPVLETLMNLEDQHLAHEATLDLLHRVPDLAGLYVAGGGMEGVIAACREHGGAAERILVCNELIPETRAALIDGIVDLVIATPIRTLAERTVAAMASSLRGDAVGPEVVTLAFDLYTPENV